MRSSPLLLMVGLALAACDPQSQPTAAAPPAATPAATRPPAAQASAPLAAAGPAISIPVEDGAGIQTSASVVRVDPLDRQGASTVKLFGVGGGDPAMNGLQTHVAFFRSPADGWAVFRIGDVLDYRILSEALGRVDLELTESHLDEATGEIGSRTRRVIVGWPASVDGSAPASVTVTPAR